MPKEVKIVTLTFDGHTIELNPDDEGRYNLNALHKAAGNAAKHQPNRWLRSSQATDLIEKFLTTQKRVIKSVSGRYGGTYAIEEIVFAYAEWISAEFHKAVIDTFTAALKGDGDKAVKKAQTVARVEGVPFRKQYTSAISLATYSGGQQAYRLATNKVYVGLFNKTTDTLRSDFGLAGRKTPRDHMGDDALGAIQAVEALAAIAMRQNHTSGERRWERVVDHVIDNVRSALGLTPSRFLDATK